MKGKGYILAAAMALFASIVFAGVAPADAAKSKLKVSKEGQACIGCHRAQSPSFVKEWELSRHA
ncbi:MAG: hypothetical protein M0Z60_05030, partial [Nitrospiraceae bacterium]|nr:hypothetical protein [Nitrospiraceae bacterium]